MVTLTAGSVILVPFPFSNLTQSKLRPAIVLADSGRADWLLCQVTSNPYADLRAVELLNSDFDHGSLTVISYARPGKVFTAHQSLFVKEIGKLSTAKLQQLVDAVIDLLRKGS